MHHSTTHLSASVTVHAPIQKIWDYWTAPEHILRWNNPSDEWKTTSVENDVRTGGKFRYVMETNDGGGFTFEGQYDEVIPFEKLSSVHPNGRKTVNTFSVTADGVTITEIFEPEAGVPAADQQAFCAGVLKQFGDYVARH
ncbi:SRPBCC domain-containing protein [Chitinophaga qingshengii]|uniref:SRPBCC domain-containing protein n=1 Tax=Chitinophaga qingshengii TaxID=1569794 RepID=A0ABR7TS42_9BACT|nr:SRPBCC domain-containing protein [Chitinophaga qingshengii]MBC9931794.1 SRPBCC domain-containing protein [Chitinophaga qingshengii]